jgi:hypothetical protein
MSLRTTNRSLFALTLLVAIGCGGPAKPAESSASPTESGGSNAPENGTSGAPNEKGSTPAKSEEGAPASSAGEKTGAGESAEAADKATITDGLQLLDRRSLSLDFALNLSKNGAGKGVNSGTWSFAEERSMRVKSAAKDVINEMQVVYGKWDAKPLLGLTYETPTNGKSYLLSHKDGNLTIVKGAGEKPSADEQRVVKLEYGYVGARSPLRQALVEANFQSGAELPKNDTIAQLIIGELPGSDPSKTEVTAVIDKVEGGARKKAILKVTAKTRIVSNKTFFDLEITGTTTVDVTTGWVLAGDLAGTAKAAGTLKHPKQGEMEVSGKSKITLTRSSEFR